MKIPKPRDSYRVLHTADWHLGKMLSDYSRDDEHLRFLEWLLHTIREEQVDVLIVAGDLFDSARPPQSAVKRYYEFLARLFRDSGGECRVIVTAGNHDSPAHLDAPRDVLRALQATVVGELPEHMTDAIVALPDDDSPRLIVAAIPFLRDRDLRSGQLGQSVEVIQEALRNGISACYEQAADACGQRDWSELPRLAIGHLTVQGACNSDSEREIHIGGLGAVATDAFPESFAYVALGHLHRPQRVEESARVCYSGSPIPLSFSESTDTKSVRIVDFVGAEIVTNEKLAIPPARRLVQLRCTRADLEDTLAQSTIEAAELTTWVELIVETTNASEDLNEVVRELTEEKPWKIVRVIARFVGEAASLTENDLPAASIESLLENPVDVFDHLLEQQAELSDDEIVALRTAFAELRDREIAMRDTDADVTVLDPTDDSLAVGLGSVGQDSATTEGDTP
jgi:exonuclease SbcD